MALIESCLEAVKDREKNRFQKGHIGEISKRSFRKQIRIVHLGS